MSTTIDNKVVKLGMDNGGFERGAKQTSGTIDKLKSGFGSLVGIGKAITFDGPAKSVEAFGLKMSATAVMGYTAMANMADSIYHKVTDTFNNIVVDPVKSGLNEYENKLQSIQTIMANTEWNNTTMDQVKAALAELNTYADQTIYSFQDMTKNIGTFTAAGVDLDTSVSAIKGIANLAARSGSSAEQASSAMYQLSQAIAAGKVNLMDWNSVVNAGMGGKMFQDALKQTGKEMGAVIDDTKSFRESLSGQDSWLTKDILLATLNKFSKDQKALEDATRVKTVSQLFDVLAEAAGSSWGVAWEQLIGDLDTASELFTSLNNRLGPIVSMPGQMAAEWATMFNQIGGRAKVISIMSQNFNGLVEIVKIGVRVFREFWPKQGPEGLKAHLLALDKMSFKFKQYVDSVKGQKQIARAFRETFTTFEAVGGVVDALADRFKQLWNWVSPKVAPNLEKAFNWGTLMKVRDFLRDVENVIRTGSIGDLGVGSIFEPFFKMLKNIDLPKVNLSFDAIYGNLKKIAGISATGGFILLIINILKTVKEYTKDNPFTRLRDGIKAFNEALNSEAMNARADALLKMAAAIGIMAGSLVLLSLIDTSKILLVASVLGILMFALNSMIEGQKISNKIEDGPLGLLKSLPKLLGGGLLDAFSLNTIGQEMLRMAEAVGILAASVVVLSLLPTQNLVRGTVAIGVIMGMLVAMMKVLQKGEKKSIEGVGNLIALVASVTLAVRAVKKLSDMKPEALVQGIIGLGLLLTEMVATAAIMSKLSGNTEGVTKGAKAMLKMSVAVGGITGMVSILSNMNMEELQKGVGGLGVILAMLVASMYGLSKADIKLSVIIGVLAIIPAIFSIKVALEGIAKIETSNLVKAGIAIGAVLLELVIAMQALSNPTILIGAAALTVASIALLAITPSLALITKIDPAKLVIMGLAIAGLFATLAIAGVIAQAAIEPIAVMVAVLAGIGAIAALVTSAMGGMADSTSTFVTTVSDNADGFGEKLHNILQAFVDNAPLMGQALLDVASNIIAALSLIIPQANAIIAAGLTTLFTAIAERAPEMMEAFAKMLVALVDGLTKWGPTIGEAGGKLIVSLINGINGMLEGIIEAALGLAIGLIWGLTEGIRKSLPEFKLAIQSLISVIVEVIAEIISGILAVIPGFGTAASEQIDKWVAEQDKKFDKEAANHKGLGYVQSYSDGINAGTPALAAAGTNASNAVSSSFNFDSLLQTGASGGSGLTAGVMSAIPGMSNAGSLLSQAGVDGFDLSKFSTAGTLAGSTLTDSLKSASSGMAATGQQAGTSGAQGAAKTKPQWAKAAGDNVNMYNQTLLSKSPEVQAATAQLMTSGLNGAKGALGIHSPSTEYAAVAGYTIQGYTNTLNADTTVAKATAKTFGWKDSDQKALDKKNKKLEKNNQVMEQNEAKHKTNMEALELTYNKNKAALDYDHIRALAETEAQTRNTILDLDNKLKAAQTDLEKSQINALKRAAMIQGDYNTAMVESDFEAAKAKAEADYKNATLDLQTQYDTMHNALQATKDALQSEIDVLEARKKKAEASAQAAEAKAGNNADLAAASTMPSNISEPTIKPKIDMKNFNAGIAKMKQALQGLTGNIAAFGNTTNNITNDNSETTTNNMYFNTERMDYRQLASEVEKYLVRR